MSESRSNQQFSYRDVFVNESNCDQTEALYSYFQGLLPEKDWKQFQQHLLVCDTCPSLLAELQDAETAAENSVLDSKKTEKIYRQTRKRIQEDLNTKYGTAGSFLLWPKSFQFPAFANAMLLLLVAILIYPSYRSLILQREVNQLQNELDQEKSRKPVPATTPVTIPSVEPIVSDSKVYPVRLERDPDENKIQLTFDAEQNTLALVFSLPPENFQSYLLKIARPNETLWQSQIPAPNEDAPQLISLQLHRAYFQESEYLLTITGQKAEQTTTLAEYKLMISK